MKAGVFTEYIRGLGSHGDPDPESFERVWRELRRQVARELEGKGLWSSPPAYLGIAGDRWTDGGDSVSALGAADALHELVTDCYFEIFVRRQPRLAARLKTLPSIDPMVVRNIRNLLCDKQRANDRLGYRVFEILKSAVEGALEAGELFVLQGDEGVIRNDTLLGFRSDIDPAGLPPAQLEEIVKPWNDSLLPELLEAKGKKRQWVVTSLRTFLSRLPRQGVEGFRFKELIDPLKHDARMRRAAQFELLQGEAVREGEEEAELVWKVPADTSVEERESFEKFLHCMARTVKQVEVKPKIKDYLLKLWNYLSEHFESEEEITQRKIAEALDLPRKRLPELFRILQGLAEACQGTRFVKPAVSLGVGAGESSGGAMGLDAGNWAEELRKRTGEARRRYADVEAQLLERSAEGPRPGDVFLLAATEDLPVDWVVLELDPSDPRRLLAVPADDHALVGSADLALPEDTACGLLILRCKFGTWLDAEDFDPQMRTGSVPPEIIAEARRKWWEVEAESVRGSDEEREVDDDEEYRSWIREVLEPARAAVRQRPAAVPRRRILERRVFDAGFYRIAASILLVVSLGLGGGMIWQSQRIARLEARDFRKPRGNVAFKPLRFSPGSTRSGTETMALPSDAKEVFLLLNVFDFSQEPYERYRLEILRKETEREVWKSGELFEVATYNLTVSLPTSLLPSGEYLFQLYGQSDEELEEFLAEYVLRIDYE